MFKLECAAILFNPSFKDFSKDFFDKCLNNVCLTTQCESVIY